MYSHPRYVKSTREKIVSQQLINSMWRYYRKNVCYQHVLVCFEITICTVRHCCWARGLKRRIVCTFGFGLSWLLCRVHSLCKTREIAGGVWSWPWIYTFYMSMLKVKHPYPVFIFTEMQHIQEECFVLNFGPWGYIRGHFSNAHVTLLYLSDPVGIMGQTGPIMSPAGHKNQIRWVVSLLAYFVSCRGGVAYSLDTVI